MKSRINAKLALTGFLLLLACSSTDDSPSNPGDAASDSALQDAGADSAVDAYGEGIRLDSEVDVEASLDALTEESGDSDVSEIGVEDVAIEAPFDSFHDVGIDGQQDSTTPNTVQLLGDNRFLQGFVTYPSTPTIVSTGSLIPPTATAPPVWGLAEWHTTRLLVNGPPTMTATGAQWENDVKRVVISDGFLELAINSDAEYQGIYRQPGQDWPHLLIQQNIFDVSNPQSNTPIHEYDSVNLSLDIELVYAQHMKEVGYDPSLHACQFLMYLTLQNRNPNHSDYGNYIWFGLSFYDDRYAFLDENVAFDLGTGKYMFRMASSAFMPSSLHDVPEVSISVELSSYLKTSVEDAIGKGILKSKQLEDYYLGGMNLGFEVPGRSVATMRVRDLSLLAKR